MLQCLNFVRRLAPAAFGPVATGLVLGVLSWAWCSQFVMVWGTGPEVCLALAVAVLLAAATVLRPGCRVSNVAPAWVWLALAAWTALTPTLFSWTTVPRASILDDAPRAFFAALTSSLLILTPAAGLLLRSLPFAAFGGAGAWKLPVAIGTAWCLAPLTVGLWPGPHAAALTAAGLLLARFARELMFQPAVSPPSLEVSSPIEQEPSWITIAVPACAAGVAMAMGQWLQTQLFLQTAALLCAAWGGLFVGIGLGVGSKKVGHESQRQRAAGQLVAIGCFVATLALTFPWCLRLAMAISASISSLPMILGLRSLIVAGMFMPAGWVLGSSLAVRRRRSESTLSFGPIVGVTCFLVALCGSRLLGATLDSAMPFTIATCGSGVVMWSLAGPSKTTSRRRRWAGFAMVGCAVLAACMANPNAHLARQRVLFSGVHFQARAAGVPADLLPSIDDGRLLRSTSTAGGVTAIWTHSGMQWVLRENGVTRGVVSTNPDLCPQPITEVLAAVLPITFHAQPHNILVTSAAYPAVVATCLSLPVESVTAIDDDPAALQFCREATERVCPSLMAGDNRLALHRADPIRGLATCGRLFDVVIAPDSVVGNLDSARQWTLEHFRDIAAHLSPEGVFCQRVTCFDLDVATVLDVVRTAQAVFPTVQLSEAAPGEWLLIARMTESMGLDQSFLERLEKPHVRDVLAQAGWDWSIMLSIKTVHPADLLTIAAHATAHAAGDAQLAFSLPVNVMRWGPKFGERRAWMSKNARPLGDALGEEPALAEIGQRLSDVTLAQQVMIDHPDQFSAYRRFVKKRLQDRPRPKVIQVAGEGLRNGLDPEDSRRKQYLTALGKAAETKSRTDIDRLALFYSPFDPLISPFIAREFVHFDRQSTEPDFAAEWRSGLRSVYFAPPTDRSVHNLCDALELVHAHPEVAGDAASQWDYRNAILESLKNRWGLRMTASVTLKYEVPDAERSVASVTTAMEDMDQLRSAAGISPEAWTSRRAVLEKHLVRPLRSWRSDQAAKIAMQTAGDRSRGLAPEKAEAEAEEATSGMNE